MQKGIIFNIQHFTIHDGPGIRTELFLKGCPLRCDWCGNPESFNSYIEPGVYSSKCLSLKKCGLCEKVKYEGCELVFLDGKLNAIESNKESNWVDCSKICPTDAIKQWGESLSVEECMKEILKDKGFYERSGGGVTVSGGEPLLQSDFVSELFKECKREGINTCFESTFHGRWQDIKKILPHTDLLISDIKHMDSALHKKYTGVNNNIILENLKRLSLEKQDLILRIPVIPNVNDNMKNMEDTANFIIDELKGHVRTLQLLSFMRLGEEKYRSLGLEYKMKDIDISREDFQSNVVMFAEYFNKRGIHCLVGTKEK